MVPWILLFCFANYFSAHAGQIKVDMNMNIQQTARYYINVLNYQQYNHRVPPSISGGVGQPVTKRVYEVVINGRLEDRTFYVVRTYNPLNSMGFCNQDKDCPNLPKAFCFGGECVEMWCRLGNDCPPGSGCISSRCRWVQSQNNCPCNGDCDCTTSEENVTRRVYQIVINGRIEVLTYLVVRTHRPLNSLRQCALDTDCPNLSEVFCFFSECLEMLCSDGSQCPSGHMCVDLRCRRAGWADKNETLSGNTTERTYNILINGTLQVVTFYIVNIYPPINQPDECTMDSQCPSRLEIFCFGGECLEMQCRDERQCPPGRTCINSRCQRAPPQIGRLCSSDADCPSPVYSTCVANTCKTLNQTCSAHTDCPKYPDVYCINDYCVKLGQHCSNLQPCPFMSLAICAGSKCYPMNLPCKSDRDCPSTSLECTDSFCVSASKTQTIRPPGNDVVIPSSSTAAPPPNGATTTAAAPASSSHTPEDVKKQILHWQNWYRSQLAQGLLQNAASKTMPPAADMNILEWNSELESGAYEFAKGCSMKPSDLSTRPDVGESIWTNSNPNLTPLKAALSAIGHWWSAPRLYGVFERTFTKAFENSVQLYAGWSQAAWAKTTKIGCYAQQCAGGMFVVCRYRERGNIIGSPFYTVGKACSACRSGTTCLTGEYKGLCSPSS